jgi:CBS domain-containing protein
MSRIRLGSKPPLTVGPDDTIVRAARAMVERHVGAAVVVEDERILGVVTERDVLQKVVAQGRDPALTRVCDVMTSPVISIGLTTSVEEASELMRARHIRHLVVVDDRGRLAGMLALRYLLYDMMDDMKRNVGDLVGYIMTDGPGG